MVTYVFGCLSSCRLLWPHGWEDFVHEDMPGEVQEVGELPSGRWDQTEDRTASTHVSKTYPQLYYCMILSTQLPLYQHFVLFRRSKGPQSEMSDPNTQSFDPGFHPTEAPSQLPNNTRDYEYGFSPEPPMQTGRADDFSAPGTTESHYINFSNTAQ